VSDERDDAGADGASAPNVPPEVTGCIVSAPPTEPSMSPGNRVTGFSGADHRVRRPAVKAGAVAGAAAALVTTGLGTAMLLASPAPSPGRSTAATADRITVSAPSPTVPLSPLQIVGLLGQRPDLGVFSDDRRRASCLSGLGYPASATVLGGQPVEVSGRTAVLLVLPGDTPQDLAALVVPPNCSSADTGLIADTRIRRP
jgi:hypothetical protein